MILKSITLDNIRSYTYQKIIFPQGSVLLSGDIGSGKSTILHAIEFAFFGIQRADLSGASLLRHGKNEGFVELHFSLDGRDITIRRTLKRSKQGIHQDAGYLNVDGVMLDLTPIEFKSRILTMLGYPLDIYKAKSFIYRYTIYTPQEQMKHILFDDRDNRYDTLRKILGVDKYKRITENTSLLARDLRDKIRNLHAQTADMAEKQLAHNHYVQEKERLAVLLHQAQASLVGIRQKSEAQKQELHRCEEALVGMRKLQQQRAIGEAAFRERQQLQQKYQQELSPLAVQVQDIRSRLTNFPAELQSLSRTELEQQIEALEKQITFALQQQTENKAKLASLDTVIKDHTQDIQQKQALVAGLLAQQTEFSRRLASRKDKEKLALTMKQNDDALQEALRHVHEHELHVKHAFETITKITQLDECPLCLQPVSSDHKYAITAEENRKTEEHHAALREFLQQKQEYEQKKMLLHKELDAFQENETQIATLQAQINSGEQVQRELEEKQRRLEQLGILMEKEQEKKITYASAAIDEQQRLLAEKKTQLHHYVEKNHLQEMLQEKEKSQKHILVSLEEGEQALARLHADIQALQAQLLPLAPLDGQYLQLRKEMEALFAEEKRLEVQQGSVLKEIEGVSRFDDAMLAELSKKETMKQEAAATAQFEQWLSGHFVNIMSVIERHILLQVYQEFNELFQKWFTMLMDDETLLVRLDPEFTPIVEQNGYETELEALSGGEKTAVALAYRLALNKVINDVISSIRTKDLIILDEPTDGFSQQQLDRVKDVLDQLDIPQILLVSHESKVESFVDHVIRIEKVHHISTVLG